LWQVKTGKCRRSKIFAFIKTANYVTSIAEQLQHSYQQRGGDSALSGQWDA